MSALPRVLYLPGFGSGPSSTKARLLGEHLRGHGLELEALDLRVPSFEHQRVSSMIELVADRVRQAGGPVALVGSSLGGLVAVHVAAREPSVAALVLLAPAFHFARCFRALVGADTFRTYERTGVTLVRDYEEKRVRRIDFGFFEDAARFEEPPALAPPLPTLVVHGLRDDVIPVAEARAYARGRPHVRLVEVDDAHELAHTLGSFREDVVTHLEQAGLLEH